MARFGRLGKVRLGGARYGEVRLGLAGEVWYGTARYGLVRLGTAGELWRGKVWQVRRGEARLG